MSNVFSKLSVLIPTRGRVARLFTLLESYNRTVMQRECAELVFRVDDDDIETQDFLSRVPDHRMLVGSRLKGYDSMSTFFNDLVTIASGDVLMIGNDDMVFQTPDWPVLLLAHANNFPDGVFNLGVRTHNETHFPFATVSRKVVGALGFIWDPTVFWGDIYLRDVMGAFGRTIIVPDVEIAHDWAGWNPDRTFLESNKDITGRDPNYWAQTHARAVANAVNRLKSVLLEQPV